MLLCKLPVVSIVLKSGPPQATKAGAIQHERGSFKKSYPNKARAKEMLDMATAQDYEDCEDRRANLV